MGTMAEATNWWNGGLNGGLSSFTSTATSTPAYDRVTSIPSWLPREGTSQLLEQYSQVPGQFDTKAYDDASMGQESRLLTTGRNAGANAAADYANRARQAGGSGMGTGLVKAQASVGAQKSAGELALDRQKFDAQQREKAATLSTQIATTLGGLRDSYLKTIVDYATREDATNAEYRAKMAAVDAQNRATDATHKNDPFVPTQFNPGYVPSFGPIRPASINGQTMPNSAFGEYPTNWLSGYHG